MECMGTEGAVHSAAKPGMACSGIEGAVQSAARWRQLQADHRQVLDLGSQMLRSRIQKAVDCAKESALLMTQLQMKNPA
eukprot:8101221-Karenia_brevis.AAC.1